MERRHSVRREPASAGWRIGFVVGALRLGLAGRFDREPEAVLAGLRGPGRGLSREYLFVLSELSFSYAARSQKPEYYLGSAVYAWAFLFGRPGELNADPLDPPEPPEVETEWTERL
jgi:hypothetical protein